MYYLRIQGEEFGFVTDTIHDILDTDIPVSNEEYDIFFEEYQGKNIRVNPEGKSIFEILEVYEAEASPPPPSEMDIIRTINDEQDSMILENAVNIAILQLTM